MKIKKSFHLNLVPIFLQLIIIAALKFLILPKFFISQPENLWFCPNIFLVTAQKILILHQIWKFRGKFFPLPPLQIRLCLKLWQLSRNWKDLDGTILSQDTATLSVYVRRGEPFVKQPYDLCTDVLVRRLRRKYLLDALLAHNASSNFCITNKNKLNIGNFTCKNINAVQHTKAVNLHGGKVTKSVTIKNCRSNSSK